MDKLSRHQRIYLTIIESTSVFITVYMNQMIITVFPNYDSVKKSSAEINSSAISNMAANSTRNCTIADPNNIYVALLIGFKYCTELILLPFVGVICDRYFPPLILFIGLLVQMAACSIYSISGSYMITILGRICDGVAYSIISTSGLTILYNIYVNDKSRNRMITVDSIVVYIASFGSPFVAGAFFNLKSSHGERFSRILSFLHLLPLLICITVALVPFAFKNKKFMKMLFKDSAYEMDKDELASECLEIKKGDTEDEIEEPTEDKLSLKEVVEHDEKEEEEVKFSGEPGSTTLLTLLMDKHIMIVLVCLTINSMAGNSLETTLPTYMIRAFCSDPEQQGVVWLFGVKSLAGFLLATLLFHKVKDQCWIVTLMCTVLHGALCCILSFLRLWWMIGIVLGFMYFLSSIIEVIMIPIVPKIIDSKYPKTYGVGSGLTLVCFTLSGLIGSFPIGPFVEYFGFTVFTLTMGVITIMPSLTIVFIRKYFI